MPVRVIGFQTSSETGTLTTGPGSGSVTGAIGLRHGKRWRRGQVFESGEMKYVILRLLREKPRHGYEIIKALEERFGGWYSPSPGTVYPTLQLLEDQGYVRVVETEGRKTYHITAEGEAFLDEHRDTIDEMFDRVRETVKDFAGGNMGELSQAFTRLAALAWRDAWKHGSGRRADQAHRRDSQPGRGRHQGTFGHRNLT